MKKNALPLFGVVWMFATQTQAVTIAQWTFETSAPSATNQASISGILPETGSGAASATHSSTGTDYTNPVGNGSNESFSANEWAVGDFFQFQVSTTGLEDIKVSFDQTRSATGPSPFSFQYSTDGAVFTSLAYTVLENLAANGGAWNSTTAISNYGLAFDLSGISALDNDSSIFFRLVADGAGSSSGGTSRVDNFLVEGDVPSVGVPESSIGLAGFAGVFALLALALRRWGVEATR